MAPCHLPAVATASSPPVALYAGISVTVAVAAVMAAIAAFFLYRSRRRAAGGGGTGGKLGSTAPVSGMEVGTAGLAQGGTRPDPHAYNAPPYSSSSMPAPLPWAAVAGTAGQGSMTGAAPKPPTLPSMLPMFGTMLDTRSTTLSAPMSQGSAPASTSRHGTGSTSR